MLKERLDAGSCPSSCVADQQTAGYMHLIAHPQRWELHWLRRHAPHAVLVSDPLLAHACHVVPPSHPAHKIAILNFSFPGDCPAKTSENKEGEKKRRSRSIQSLREDDSNLPYRVVLLGIFYR